MALILVASALAPLAPASAAVTGDPRGNPSQRINHWSIYEKADLITDKPSCKAFYDDRPDVELTPDTFYVGFDDRGGLVDYVYRLDDGQPVSQFASPREAASGIATIMSSNLTRLLDAHRLRFRAITRIAGVIDEDFDISGVAEVMAAFASKGCAPIVQPASTQAPPPSADAASSGYVYGPKPDWTQFKALGTAAILQQMGTAKQWSVFWPYGYAATGWLTKRTKEKVRGYFTCGVLRPTDALDGDQDLFAVVIDRDQVKVVDVDKNGGHGPINAVCSVIVRQGVLPPAPSNG